MFQNAKSIKTMFQKVKFQKWKHQFLNCKIYYSLSNASFLPELRSARNRIRANTSNHLGRSAKRMDEQMLSLFGYETSREPVAQNGELPFPYGQNSITLYSFHQNSKRRFILFQLQIQYANVNLFANFHDLKQTTDKMPNFLKENCDFLRSNIS